MDCPVVVATSVGGVVSTAALVVPLATADQALSFAFLHHTHAVEVGRVGREGGVIGCGVLSPSSVTSVAGTPPSVAGTTVATGGVLVLPSPNRPTHLSVPNR